MGLFIIRNCCMLKPLTQLVVFARHSKRCLIMLQQVTSPSTVLVNHAEGDAQVQLSFTYTEPLLNFERIFNFNRPPLEEVASLSSKITSSIEKFLSKKAEKKKKKKPDGWELDESILRPPVQVLVDGEPASPEMTCREALVTRGRRAALRVGRQLYRLRVNPPAVAALELPAHPMAGFPVYPRQLRLAFAAPADSRLRWEREPDDGAAWRPVGEGATYVPTAADVGRRLRLVCEPACGEARGRSAAALSEPVRAGPGPCPFERRHAFTGTIADRDSYRVVSYNILADLYADSDYTRTVLHPYCPPHALHIDYRKQLILKELLGYNGDVVCLQEVDKKVFDGDLAPNLRRVGLEGVFTYKGGYITEGLVCFYRTDKLRLLESENVLLGEVFSQDPLFEDVERACVESPQLRERLTNRTQALQVVVLESTVAPSDGRPPRLLVVANTHLYFHPVAVHVRALQAGMCMRLLQRLMERLRAEEPGREMALLFCGDFNSPPESSVLRLMTDCRLEEDLADFTSNPGEEVHGVSFNHPYRMASACGLPAYTNHVDKFFGCLDYIFYMPDRMEVRQVVPLPSHEEVTRHTALPSVVFPSDHLALVADVAWRDS